jgi:hypothetical protein
VEANGTFPEGDNPDYREFRSTIGFAHIRRIGRKALALPAEMDDGNY